MADMNYRTLILFFYLLAPLLTLASLMLIWVYMKREYRTTGFKLLIASIALVSSVDLVQALNNGIMSGYLIDGLYKLSIVCIAASWILVRQYPIQAEQGLAEPQPVTESRTLKSGVLFMAYPALIFILKGFSVYVFLYFTIIIMAYFIVRLYAKQIAYTRKLLDTEREYSEKLRLYMDVVEQSPLSIVITDMDSLIEYINPYFTEVTGYSKEEAVGNKPSILRSDKNQAETYRNMWETLILEGKWQGNSLTVRRAGKSTRKPSLSLLLRMNGARPRIMWALRRTSRNISGSKKSCRTSCISPPSWWILYRIRYSIWMPKGTFSAVIRPMRKRSRYPAGSLRELR